MQISRETASNLAVVFDVDGTMVDNAAFHQAAWIELCQRHGKPITPEYYASHIHARSNELIVPDLFDGECPPEFIAKISRQKEQLYRDLYSPVIREMPGLTALLKALQDRNVPCAAASNSPKANVDMVLDRLGIRPYFQVVVDREQVERGKPHPDLLLTVARALGFPPARCIVFEDSAPGFAAADHAGMPYIAITAGACPEELNDATNAIAMHQDFTSVDPNRLPVVRRGG